MTDVTVVQCLGLIAIYFLLADMFCWMQWAHAPMSQRPGPFRRALLGVAYAAMWGGVWAFLQFSAGARPEGPRVQW